MKKLWSLIFCILFFYSKSYAQSPLPPQPNLLLNGNFSSGLSSWTVTNNDVATYSVSDVLGEKSIGAKAFHVELKVKPETKPWDVTLLQEIPLIFRAGENVVLTGKARSPQNLSFYAFVEEGKEPYTKDASVRLTLSKDWQHFEARGILTHDYASGELRAGVHLASGTGTIEITDLKLTRSQPDLKPTVIARHLVSNGDFLEPLGQSWKATARVPVKASIIDLNEIGPAGLKKALKVELNSPPTANLWEARVAPPRTNIPIKKGDMIFVQFWARTNRKNRANAVFQQAEAPYEKTLIEVSYLLPTWKKFTYYARASRDFAPQESSFEIQIGGVRGSVEFTGIRVENLGQVTNAEVAKLYGPNTTSYFGAETPNDDWKASAFARIEKYRKGNIEIKVVDGSGKPLRNAKVNIVQIRQAFRFGTAVNSWLLRDDSNSERYRAIVKRLFNTAVLENDMKWHLVDGDKAVEQRGVDSVKWLRDNGLEVRGHTMLWGSWRYSPARLEKLSPEEIRAEIKKRVFEVGSKFEGQLYAWDVVNEAATNNAVFDKAGWDLFPQTFKWAREADKNAKLVYNDYDISNEGFDNGKHRGIVESRIQQLLDSGAPVDMLGDQAHMFTPFPTMPRMLGIWNRWSKKYRKPLEVTEFDAAIADDAVHEKYIRDYMIAAFSQPNIESFIFWGFWENAHWRGANAALYRSDWTPRPAALAVEDLILKQWKTDIELSTNSKGVVKTRGFLGDYEIRVSLNGKEVKETAKLTKSGLGQIIVLD
jgi:endo-1,4-beta-xylanase